MSEFTCKKCEEEFNTLEEVGKHSSKTYHYEYKDKNGLSLGVL